MLRTMALYVNQVAGEANVIRRVVAGYRIGLVARTYEEGWLEELLERTRPRFDSDLRSEATSVPPSATLARLIAPRKDAAAPVNATRGGHPKSTLSRKSLPDVVGSRQPVCGG